ncbi:unnamed protein product [Somion occarium]|uniref:Rad4-domain-containing protein n=1 Tax=Somion occarium TaxID=3059160 RepID=A0ABP1E2F4_9APHY
MATPTYTENTSVADADSDDDFDWEEVDVPQHDQTVDLSVGDHTQDGPSSLARPNIEITIQTKPKKDEEAKKRTAQIQAERVARLHCHQMHTIALIGNARIRNTWINDELLHARLLSLTPLAIQNSFAMIHKSRVPEAAKRGRLFESAIGRLVEWWTEFFEVEATGHIRNRTFEEVQRKTATMNDPKGKGRAIDLDDEEDAEIIRSPKSLMKHALMRRGSRDVSAQLFTALCRALRIPARLVVSLQSVPWKASVGKPKPPSKKKKTPLKGKGKEVSKDEEEPEEDDDMEMEEVSIPGSPAPRANGKGKAKAFPGDGLRVDGRETPPSAQGKAKAPPVINLRKSKGQRLGSAPVEQRRRERTPDPTTTPPVFWTEVFSRADGRWLPVDPIRAIVNKRKAFDPTPNPNAAIKPERNVRVENRMVYVVAFEEDGYARDVTPRYAREFGAKVAKIQQGGKGRKQWWERIMSTIHRPYRLNRDDVEEEELHINQMMEHMPTSMIGFKDHPLYVLARHLKRDEVIHPLTEIGKFRGEPVYPRSNVLSLKTAENWMRQGRKVREGCQPMKWVKQRAVTVNKQRAIEMAMADRLEVAGEGSEGFGAEKDIMQGLYAENQTELYIPEPVVNGKIPKNDFGNIDLYVPTMLPAGAAYIPHKGAAKIARQLGFDYAEAVTGFEFKKRRAFPVITGIVVAAENEDAVLEAYREAEQEAEKKRQAKRQDRVLKRWTRLIQGLRIRQRLQEQYADREPQATTEGEKPIEEADEEHVPAAGGFLTSADDVVQPYSLPRSVYAAPKSPSPSSLQPPSAADNVQEHAGPSNGVPLSLEEIPDSEGEEELEVVPIPNGGAAIGGVPMSMRELAEAAERQPKEAPLVDEVEYFPSPPPPSVAQRALEKASGKSTPRSRARTRSGTSTPRSAKTAKEKTPQKSRKRTREDVESDVETDEVQDVVPTPSKRTRVKPAPPPVVKSDRVLRARKGKSESMLAEERELEEAYRKAVAE